MRGLNGKLVAITGAAGAIGRATAQRFIEEGARVIALDIDGAALESLREELPGLAGSGRLDVSDPESVTAAFETVEREHGALEVLINNAGVNARHPFTDIPFADWRRVMSVNVDGAFLVAQAAARQMRATGRGVILHTASTNGLVGYRDHAIYSSGKAAVIEMSRAMALDLAPEIRVNALCPGYVQTPLMTAGAEQAASIPLRRFGLPEEVAALFAFLASDDAAFITGQEFVIDGGEIAGGMLSRFGAAATSRLEP